METFKGLNDSTGFAEHTISLALKLAGHEVIKSFLGGIIGTIIIVPVPLGLTTDQ